MELRQVIATCHSSWGNNMTIQIGMVGIGGMGTVHLSNYAHMEGCRVVAAVDQTDAAKERAKEFDLRLYPSIDLMLEKEKLDLVDVCSPTFLHKEHVTNVLEHGISVICEKPLTFHKKDAEDLFHLAEAKGVNLYVGQVLRFFRESQILRELMESGEYGKVLDANFERLSACPRWVSNGWLFDKEKSGHLPFDLHIHDLDLMVSLFGKPDDFTFTSCGNKEKEYKEAYRFSYRFGELTAVAEAAWYNADFPFTARYRIYFERAVLVNDGKSLIAYEWDKEPRVFDTEESIKIPTGINLPPTGVFLEELSHFIDCVKKGKPSEWIRKDQVISVIEILEEINKRN